jgi:AraC-like DNA-binding protein
VGFSSDDAFRRAFERRFGVTPGAYRSRFAAPLAKDDDHEIALHS